MMMDEQLNKLNRDAELIADALDWRDRLDSYPNDGELKKEFADWLAGGPEREAACARMQRVWDAAGEVESHAELAQMRETALANSPRRRTLWYSGIAAAALVLVIIGAVLVTPYFQNGQSLQTAAVSEFGETTYQTALGERSTVTLDDGSTVTLNTSSKMVVTFSADNRRIHLLEGQAIFDVVTDPDRPFEVRAGGQRIVALGTAFDVLLDRNDVRVTLVQGRVSVRGEDQKTASVTQLVPGQQLIASASIAPIVKQVDVERHISWRDGRLMFKNDTLADAIVEINRYTSQQLVLGDNTLASYRITGVFRTGQIDSFVAAVESSFPISATPAKNGIIHLHRARQR